jgi:hypothetical protein
MFHVLKDENQIVAILANIETEQVQDAIAKVDKVFTSLIDEVSNEDLPCAMCEALGIAHSILIDEWTDVLVALLVDGGATEVEYLWHECVPRESRIGEVI